MLANVYDPVNDKKTYDIQPKYDGFRCIIAKIDGVLQLYSRNLKPLNVPHILEQIKIIQHGFDFDNYWLDGELYCHGQSFQTIQSWIKKAGNTNQQYIDFICYDVMPSSYSWTDLGFRHRFSLFEEGVASCTLNIKISKTWKDFAPLGIETLMDQVLADGYEGVILRNKNGQYKHGRSKDLLKYKRFLEEEFEIIEVGEGKGKNKGTAIFTCAPRVHDTILYELRFTVTAPGDYAMKALYLKDEHIIGKMVTVKYQEKTDSGIPRFPVAIGFKEDR